MLVCWQDGVDGEMNGVAERSSKEPSPVPSPSADRRAKGSQSSTLPVKGQETPSAQLEGFLHRKHEWEGHNKKASSRYEEHCPQCTLKSRFQTYNGIIIGDKN